MAAADPKLQALLELERRGELNPQASQMLQAYRAQGTTKTKPLGPNGQAAPSNENRLARIIHPVEFGALSFKHLASSEHT